MPATLLRCRKLDVQLIQPRRFQGLPLRSLHRPACSDSRRNHPRQAFLAPRSRARRFPVPASLTVHHWELAPRRTCFAASASWRRPLRPIGVARPPIPQNQWRAQQVSIEGVGVPLSVALRRQASQSILAGSVFRVPEWKRCRGAASGNSLYIRIRSCLPWLRSFLRRARFRRSGVDLALRSAREALAPGRMSVPENFAGR